MTTENMTEIPHQWFWKNVNLVVAMYFISSILRINHNKNIERCTNVNFLAWNELDGYGNWIMDNLLYYSSKLYTSSKKNMTEIIKILYKELKFHDLVDKQYNINEIIILWIPKWNFLLSRQQKNQEIIKGFPKEFVLYNYEKYEVRE